MTGRSGSQDARAPRPPEHRWRVPVVVAIAVVALVAALVFAFARKADAPGPVASGPGTGAASTSTSTSVDDGSGAPSTTEGDEEPASTTTEPYAGPTAITLAFAGDLLPHLPLVAQAARYGDAVGRAHDFDPMFAPMKPVLEPADVAICHMEVPVAPDQGDITGYPAFGEPVEVVDGAKAAGYDGCSTASNHSLDRGRDGIAATLDRFDQLGLHHAGTARSAEEAATTTFYDVSGVKVAHLSYAYDFNGYQLPADAPWAANRIDVAAIQAAAAKARGEGAQLVVLSLHWGNEYQHDPSEYQRDIAAQLLPSDDLDLVIGHHAHVVQPIERVEGTFVVWGLGNQLANQREVPRSDGLTVVVTATPTAPATGARWAVQGIEAVPTYVEDGTFRILPVVATLADPATPPGLRDELVGAYDRTAAVLGRIPTEGVTLPPRP